MIYTITNALERISFHDSSIENISRNSNELILTFDWATIQDYEEDSRIVDIVVGECYLLLSGVTSEIFLKHEHTLSTGQTLGTPQVHVPIDVEKGFSLIAQNKFTTTTTGQILLLGGVYEGAEGVYWLEHKIHFQTGCFNWNNHVTVADWRQGAIPK